MGSIEGKCRSLQPLFVGKAEEKPGDLVPFVATTTSHFHAKEILAHLRFEAFVELPPPNSAS